MFDPLEIEAETLTGWIVYFNHEYDRSVYLPLHTQDFVTSIPYKGDICVIEGPDDNGDVQEVKGKVNSISRSYRFKPSASRLFCEIQIELAS